MMQNSKWKTLTMTLLVVFYSAIVATGCSDDPQGVDNHVENQEPNQNQEPNKNQEPNQNQEESTALAESHQLCAAAGRTSGGSLSALHCFAPHDISGFEAKNDTWTWQPGAFHVVAE